MDIFSLVIIKGLKPPSSSTPCQPSLSPSTRRTPSPPLSRGGGKSSEVITFLRNQGGNCKQNFMEGGRKKSVFLIA